MLPVVFCLFLLLVFVFFYFFIFLFACLLYVPFFATMSFAGYIFVRFLLSVLFPCLSSPTVFFPVRFGLVWFGLVPSILWRRLDS